MKRLKWCGVETGCWNDYNDQEGDVVSLILDALNRSRQDVDEVPGLATQPFQTKTFFTSSCALLAYSV